MDRPVTHLSGLPHLPGVSHLHVNRPLVNYRLSTILYLFRLQSHMECLEKKLIY